MSLTKEQAKVEFRKQAYKRNNVVYLDRFDCAIVYRAGKAGKPDLAFDNLRYYEDTRPMSRLDKLTGDILKKNNEIITYVEKGKTYVLAKSGGVSLFDGASTQRSMRKNDCWHFVVNASAANKKLDPALIIEKKTKANGEGLFHYSIQPRIDMTVEDFLTKLKAFAAYIKRV